MRKVIATAAIAQAALVFPIIAASADSAVYQHPAGWRVIRTDYIEFCDVNVASIGVTDGSLHGSIGNCDPNRNGPTKQVDARADGSDIIALRKMLSNLEASTLTDRSSAAAQTDAPKIPIVLSGPVTLTIERDGGKLSVDLRSPCLTEAGRSLLQLVDRTIEPLRRLGLR